MVVFVKKNGRFKCAVEGKETEQPKRLSSQALGGRIPAYGCLEDADWAASKAEKSRNYYEFYLDKG